MTEDREIQKQIAEEAQVGDAAAAASPAVRAFQFFLVPLLIVGACVLIYALLNWVVANPRSPQEWLKDIKEGGHNTRPHATLQFAQALRRMERPDTTLTPDVMEVYRSTKPSEDEVRRYLAMCLGYLRDPLATDLLLDAVKNDRNMETRAAAFDALGAIKDPRTLAALVNLLDDADAVVRKYAAFNAGAVAEKAGGENRAAAVEAIRKKLADPVADVTWNAAFALAYFLGDGTGTDTLKKMLDRKYLATRISRNDPNWQIHERAAMLIACKAAEQLKDQSFLPILKELTDKDKERDPDVRFVVHQTINKLQEKK